MIAGRASAAPNLAISSSPRRARVSLAGGRTKGALRVRLVASKAPQSLQPDLIVQARTTVR